MRKTIWVALAIMLVPTLACVRRTSGGDMKEPFEVAASVSAGPRQSAPGSISNPVGLGAERHRVRLVVVRLDENKEPRDLVQGATVTVHDPATLREEMLGRTGSDGAITVYCDGAVDLYIEHEGKVRKLAIGLRDSEVHLQWP